MRVAPVIARTQATGKAFPGRHLASVPRVRSRTPQQPVLVPVETDNLGVVFDEELDDVVGASGILGERRRVSLGAAQAQKERAKRGRDVPDAAREGGGLVRVRPLGLGAPRVGLGAPSKKRGDGGERPLGADVEGVEQRSEGENPPGPRGHRRHREEGVVQAEGEKRLREGGEVELEHAGYGVCVGASLQRHHLAPVVPDAALLDLVVVSANFEHVLRGLDSDCEGEFEVERGGEGQRGVGTKAGSGRGELNRVERRTSPDDERPLTMRIKPCNGLRDYSRQAAALPARILHADAEHWHRSSRAGGSPETLFLIITPRCESSGRACVPGRPRRFARGVPTYRVVRDVNDRARAPTCVQRTRRGMNVLDAAVPSFLDSGGPRHLRSRTITQEIMV